MPRGEAWQITFVHAAPIRSEGKNTRLADSPVLFQCQCDRILGAAATPGIDEIKDLMAWEEDLKMNCDYGGEGYVLGVVDYRRILNG